MAFQLINVPTGNDPFIASLTAAIDNAVTTIPASGNLGIGASDSAVVKIDDELMLVTAGGNGSSWTVTRGFEGTTAAAHSNATKIYPPLSKRAIELYLAERVTTGSGSFPSSPKEGDLFIPQNASPIDLCRYNGSGWDKFAGGKLVTPPLLSSFTQISSPPASLTVSSLSEFGVDCNWVGNYNVGSINMFQWVKTAPSSDPTVELGFDFSAWNSAEWFAGVTLRNSSTGNFEFWGAASDGNNYIRFGRYNMTNPTSSAGTPYRDWKHGHQGTGRLYLRVRTDGTDRAQEVSQDGKTWMLIRQSRTYTPDQVGFCVGSNAAGAFGSHTSTLMRALFFHFKAS